MGQLRVEASDPFAAAEVDPELEVRWAAFHELPPETGYIADTGSFSAFERAGMSELQRRFADERERRERESS